MYCDFICGNDCTDINEFNLYDVLIDGLYCLFDEGFINDVQLCNLVLNLTKIRSNFYERL